MDVSNKVQDQLARIKNTVKTSFEYNKNNIDRFNSFQRFAYESNWTADESNLLLTQGKPDMQFNVVEPYVSRMLGEFMDNEPSLVVSAANERKPEPVIVDLMEQHIRSFLYAAKQKDIGYRIFKDILTGGFSVGKVFTDYCGPKSMDQEIKFERCYDPTLCGFDLVAKEPHKGDGRYSFELFPKTQEEMEEWGDENEMDMKKYMSNMRFLREGVTGANNFAGFNWSYMNGKEKITLLCDYYEKKKKRTKIVRLSNGQVMTDKEFSELKNNWSSIEQLPTIVGKSRMGYIDLICKYLLIENNVLEYEETDYSMLPHIFFDGNSILLKTAENGNIRFFTRPYIINAMGAQKLKNYAGVAWANELENMVQHKFMVKKEALPKEEDFLKALEDVQHASVIVTNAFYENDPNMPIPDPIREVVRPPMPPEISNAFLGSDQIIQNCMGSFDASLSRNNYQLSGVAMNTGMTISNSAAKPYINGYLQGLQRVAECYLDLFPKYYNTDRTISIVDKEGNHHTLRINGNNKTDFDYTSGDLDVHVYAGVNFQIQKSNALMTIEALMKVMPQFAQFFNEKGMKVLLDNVDIHSIDQIKSLADEWMQEQAQMKKMAMQAQQQAMQNNPQAMKAKTDQAKMQLDAQKHQSEFMLELEKLKQEQQKLLAQAEIEHQKSAVQILKAETERFSKEVELKLAHHDMQHKHMKERTELHHMINSANKESNTSHKGA